MNAEDWILVVDDSDAVRDVLVLLLEGVGYRAVAVADGVEALERLRAAGPKPRLVLLDAMMPRMDGADVLRAIRADRDLAGLAVVVLSGGGAAAVEAARALAADGCLTKPVELDELLAVVARFAGAGAPVPPGPERRPPA